MSSGHHHPRPPPAANLSASAGNAADHRKSASASHRRAGPPPPPAASTPAADTMLSANAPAVAPTASAAVSASASRRHSGDSRLSSSYDGRDDDDGDGHGFNDAEDFLSVDEATLYSRAPEPDLRRRFEVATLTERVIDNVPQLSCQATNTASRLAKASGMRHTEGGWPSSVDPEEADDRIKYVKRVQRDDGYLRAVADLLNRAISPLRANSALDVYAAYFGADFELQQQALADRGLSSSPNSRGQQQHHDATAASGGGGGEEGDEDEASPYRHMRGGKGRHVGARGFQVPQYGGSTGDGDDNGQPTFRVIAKLLSPLSEQSRANQVSAQQQQRLDEDDRILLGPSATPASASTTTRRAVGRVRDLCWLTGDTTKFAAVYPQSDSATAAATSSQDAGATDAIQLGSARAGAVWDVADATAPVAWLKAPAASSGLTSIAGSVRDSHIVVAGSSSGIVAVYDTRDKHRDHATNSTSPVLTSSLLHGHGGPVEAVRCVVSKGLEFFTAGADGQVLYWDARNLSAPTERMMLTSPANVTSGNTNDDDGDETSASEPALYAVSCLDYDAVQAASAKIVVGTSDGTVVLCSRASGRSTGDRIAARLSAHHGPVRGVSRHPTASKTFLSVGDWGIKIFSEELRTPIVQTPSQPSRQTVGRWHPTRASVFMTGSQDGALHAYDVLVSLERPVMSLALDAAGAAVTSLAPHPTGALVAAGAADGTISLVRLPHEMAQPNRKEERAAVSALIDRETARERSAVAVAEAKARNQKRRGGDATSPRRRQGVFLAREHAAATKTTTAATPTPPPPRTPTPVGAHSRSQQLDAGDDGYDDDFDADPEEPAPPAAAPPPPHRVTSPMVPESPQPKDDDEDEEDNPDDEAGNDDAIVQLVSHRAMTLSVLRQHKRGGGGGGGAAADDGRPNRMHSMRSFRPLGAAATRPAEEEAAGSDAVIVTAVAEAEDAFLSALGIAAANESATTTSTPARRQPRS